MVDVWPISCYYYASIHKGEMTAREEHNCMKTRKVLN